MKKIGLLIAICLMGCSSEVETSYDFDQCVCLEHRVDAEICKDYCSNGSLNEECITKVVLDHCLAK